MIFIDYLKNVTNQYRQCFFCRCTLFHSYYIFDKTIKLAKMKSRKKEKASLKKNGKKPVSSKPLLLIDKTVATTKQKTHNTIEDHHQKRQSKKSVRCIKNLTPRNSLLSNKQRGSVSPFSSNQRSSLSPKHPPKVSPSCKKSKEKVKKKSKPILASEKQLQNQKNETLNKQVKKRQCKVKQHTYQSEYQNLFMRRLDEKKITQLSQQSQISSPKISKLLLKNAENQQQPQTYKRIDTTLKQFRHKIKVKYRHKYPILKQHQLKFLCSIVLVQRLWRQYKTKKVISVFLIPRAVYAPIISFESHREINNSKLDISLTTQQQTLELIRKYHSFNPNNTKKILIQRGSHSTEFQAGRKVQMRFKLNDLDVSSQLTPQRYEKLIRFIDVFRDISIQRPKKHQQRSKIKVFSLQQSLSQSCLMQKLYKKVFKDQPKANNFQLFTHKKVQKQLQRSIQLLKLLKTPEKAQFEEIVQVSQRFETQINQSNLSQHLQPRIKKADASVETDQITSVKRQELNSIKQLNILSEAAISIILTELSQQVDDFIFKRKIVNRMKKHVTSLEAKQINNSNNNLQNFIIHRKGCMPGFHIPNAYIIQYLKGLSNYMFENYELQTIRRYHAEYPLSILKIHRNQDDYYAQIEFQDEQFGMPIISNILFYQYQIIYQEKFFAIPQQQKKYANFLQGLIKIHNLLFRDCLEELLNKKKLKRQILPWDHIFDPYKSSHEGPYERSIINRDLKKIIDTINDFSSLKLGQFHNRFDDYEEEQKFLRCLKEQCQDEIDRCALAQDYLSSRLDLSIDVENDLIQQVIKELLIIF